MTHDILNTDRRHLHWKEFRGFQMSYVIFTASLICVPLSDNSHRHSLAMISKKILKMLFAVYFEQLVAWSKLTLYGTIFLVNFYSNLLRSIPNEFWPANLKVCNSCFIAYKSFSQKYVHIICSVPNLMGPFSSQTAGDSLQIRSNQCPVGVWKTRTFSIETIPLDPKFLFYRMDRNWRPGVIDYIPKVYVMTYSYGVLAWPYYLAIFDP